MATRRCRGVAKAVTRCISATLLPWVWKPHRRHGNGYDCMKLIRVLLDGCAYILVPNALRKIVAQMTLLVLWLSALFRMPHGACAYSLVPNALRLIVAHRPRLDLWLCAQVGVGPSFGSNLPFLPKVGVSGPANIYPHSMR